MSDRPGAPEPQREPVTEEQLDAIDRMGSPLLRALVLEVRASRDAYDRGYREAQLRLEESVLTRVATEARRKALEEATRAAESVAVDRHAGSEWNRGVGFAVSRIRELITKEST